MSGGSRGLIVGRLRPDSEAAVAEIFAEFDATELPRLVGVRHRSLFLFRDVYLHLVETDRDFATAVAGVRGHPLFVAISERLAEHVLPYDPATWRSPRDSFAHEFYSWDTPDDTTGSGAQWARIRR
jgi:cyclase